MSAIQRFDFTLKAEGYTQERVADILREWCNKWVFQLERSESDYEHYQGRINMMKPKRLEQAIKIWQELLPSIHISATSNACKSFNYVMKADTRVDGPWSDETPMAKITPQLADFMDHEMYGWQKEVCDICTTVDFRKIIVILDEIGNTGKSILAEWLEYKGLAYEIPPFTNMEDIMQCAMGIAPQKCYLIDMPKGMKKDKLASFYAGIEALKNGVMYDKRYAFKKRRIARPQIIIFTNTLPDVTLLSIDRWKVYRISSKLNLVEVDLDQFKAEADGNHGATL